MKRLFAMLMAAIMIVSLMSVAAFADGTTPVDPSKHTFVAYQIFSGTQTDDETDATLGDVEWGTGVNGAALLVKLQSDDTFKVDVTDEDGNVTKVNAFAACETAADVAAVMSTWEDRGAMAMEFAKLAYECIDESKSIALGTELDPGYYLVVDTTDVDGENDAANLALLQLTKKGAFEVQSKNEYPNAEKEVSSNPNGLKCEITDEDHVHNSECYDWAETNELAIGDTASFRITSKIPATAVNYDYYFFIVEDTLSEGLTFDETSLKVYIDGKLATKDEDYTVKAGVAKDDPTFRVALIDAIANAGKEVVVTYDAVLNANAVVGSEGNLNTADVKFSNKPNEKYEGENDDENPGFPKDETKTPLGQTPDQITLTFTTQLKVFKVDENKNPLTGAQFTLSGESLNIVLVAKDVFTADAEGTFFKLTEDGSYTTEAPVEKDTMEARTGLTAGYVEAESDYAGDDTIEVDNVTYRPYKPAADAGKTVYVLVKANANLYEKDGDGKYVMYKKDVELEAIETKDDGSKISVMVDDNGVATFTGLSAGDYTLEETVVPAGYNPIPAITFTITWTAPTENPLTATSECTWEVEDVKNGVIEWKEADNAFEITVVNQKGGTLPETGGIGTTIFYVCGAAMVLFAGIMLITKKRMSTAE